MTTDTSSPPRRVEDRSERGAPSVLSPTSPVAQFPPPSTLSERSRATEFYGFVAWASTSLLFILYLLWGILPDEWITWMGVDWYPSREWAILLPAYSMVIVLLTYFVYFALALSGTASFSDLSAIQDSKAHIPEAESSLNPYLERAMNPDAFQECYDVPLGLVNRVLYNKRDYQR